MSRYHSYLNSAVQTLKLYNGNEPFSAFSKKFFSSNKKYGSKDRKQISHLCYCYFRLGKAMHDLPAEEKIVTGLFLCSTEPNEILEAFKPEWNCLTHLLTEKKLLIINPPAGRAGPSLLIQDVFPWKNELSEGIDHEKFCESFFIQPDLFLRLRPGCEKMVKEKLESVKIDFKEIDSSCLALTNTSKIDEVIELDKEAVIQDYSSQKVSDFFPSSLDRRPLTVWDCCAGSGGKSLLLYDAIHDIALTVSDIRESILANLKKRFSIAGIKKYHSFITDLTHSLFTTHLPKAFGTPFDLILCDAPCTGSGTWSRTPEQLHYFDAMKIEEYAALQKKIISNAIPQLERGGHLLYITCSVFEKENEAAVDFIKEKFQLELVKMELLKGYDKKADTTFVALMKKPL